MNFLRTPRNLSRNESPILIQVTMLQKICKNIGLIVRQERDQLQCIPNV